ncbi:unnamed protein product [Timema podura]|uniref:Protein sleepless n=1 Tax=Timema podura TaxID=61482 RepID=A0ABN7P1R4_TIMPD|nr:unnamed protein product [Timema podura]
MSPVRVLLLDPESKSCSQFEAARNPECRPTCLVVGAGALRLAIRLAGFLQAILLLLPCLQSRIEARTTTSLRVDMSCTDFWQDECYLEPYDGIAKTIIMIVVECVGDGRWRQVIRRCASVAENGVIGVCNWGVYDNGVYWEECYCSQDGCNGASTICASLAIVAGTLLLVLAIMKSF